MALSKDGRFAALHVGQNRLHIVDVSDPRNPRLAFEDDRLGLFYMRPFSPDLYRGRFLLCQWHVTGLFLYDLLAGAGPRYTELSYPFRIGSQNGAVPWGEEWLVTRRSGYFLVKPGETSVAPAEMEGRRPAGVDLSGKPSVYGSTLFVSNRYTGRVSAVDIGNFDRPELLGALELDEHPGIVVESGDVALIPAGYQGLLGWRYRREER